MHPDLIKSPSQYKWLLLHVHQLHICHSKLLWTVRWAIRRKIDFFNADRYPAIDWTLPSFIPTKVAIAHLIKFQLALSSRFE